MNKTEKIVMFIALAMIGAGFVLLPFRPGWPIFVPVGVGCLLLQLLRTSITVRIEEKRKRLKQKVKAKLNIHGNKPDRQWQGQKGLLY